MAKGSYKAEIKRLLEKANDRELRLIFVFMRALIDDTPQPRTKK